MFGSVVSNYTVLTEGPELYDYQSNPCRDELTFVAKMTESLAAAGIPNRQFVVDTSRNGRVKPQGESDGSSDPNAPRFDPSCVSADSTPNAPQAGEWYHDYVLSLVTNANPAL